MPSSSPISRALAATNGQLHAILSCAAGREPKWGAAPQFHGKATITSDRFVMCNFTDSQGRGHMGAFVGSLDDLDRNVDGLCAFLKLKDGPKHELKHLVNVWLGLAKGN